MFPSHRQARTMSRALGWFSVGVGVVQIVAAPPLARIVGLRGLELLVRAIGVRNAVNGVGLLATRRPGPWLWGRVGGDAMDIAALASALPGRHGGAAAAGMVAVAGMAAVDLACARSLTRERAQPVRDYSGRSGWPKSVASMRGAALQDFTPPEDMRIPAALRPVERNAASQAGSDGAAAITNPS